MSVNSSGRDCTGEKGLLHGTEEHRHAGAVGVVPVDVVEHLLAGVDQRVKRADAFGPTTIGRTRLLAARSRRRDAERVDQAWRYHAAVRHVAGPASRGK